MTKRALILFFTLVAAASADDPQAWRWLPQPTQLSQAVTDHDPQSYEILCQAPARFQFDSSPGIDPTGPCDVGLQWSEPRKLSDLVVDYATLQGRAYEPAVAGQTLQYWRDGAWQSIAANIEIDYRGQAEFAALQGSGTARWIYSFSPVETTRIRLLLTQPRSLESWHRLYAVRRMEASAPDRPFRVSPVRILGAASTPAPSEFPATGHEQVSWPRKMLVNHVKATPAPASWNVEWWDGAGWRAVEMPVVLGPSELGFLPVATERLRVRAAQRIEVSLDADGERYFDEVRQARTDLLGERFRAMPKRDLAAMQSLLLPINFGRIALGRPADEEETHVAWNGTFLMVENATGGAWIMGESKPEPSPDRYDRWFALAAGVEKTLFGNDWTRTLTRYVDDYLPATITMHEQGGFSFAEKLYVTAPGDPVYGTVLEVEITNTNAKPGRTALTVILGRRGNFRWDRDRRSPLSFDPKLTGYYLDDDKRTIRGSDGTVILHAESDAIWEGTQRENHLRYPIALGPKQKQTLHFFAPSVTAPIKKLETFTWQAAFERFRAFWIAKLTSGMKLDLPEPALNTIYKNLLAQALIITQDGPNEVKYGAYGYEMFFGVEEGWPAVALAQYGHSKAAQDIASIMLSPRIMDKSNYHHPSRNGLEPWIATTIYRLTHDREWLEKITPRLEEAAEWTIGKLHENKSRKYAGILPRHAYGGDIDTPAYSLGANAACWRGLQDTALILRILGRAESAKRLQDEANAFRRRLWAVADELADHAASPVFLPVSFDIGNGAANRAKEPAYAFLGNNVPASDTWNYLSNYWNISAPGILELKLFEKGDPRSAWIADYMDAHGGVMAGLARFTIGFDQIYGKGYYESLLERGKRAEFWTSLYGIFAHGMSQNLHSFPEVCGVFPLRVSNSAMQHEYARSQWDWGFQGWRNCEGEPLSAGPGMALQVLRMALVREATEDTAQDTLLLLDGAPADWFEPGKKIAVRDAPTFFGKITFETEAFPGRVQARVIREPNFTARRVVLRLAHPLREVLINGREWKEFSGEQITLPEGDSLEISARY